MQGAVLCLTVVHSDVILVSAVLTNLTISVFLCFPSLVTFGLILYPCSADVWATEITLPHQSAKIEGLVTGMTLPHQSAKIGGLVTGNIGELNKPEEDCEFSLVISLSLPVQLIAWKYSSAK